MSPSARTDGQRDAGLLHAAGRGLPRRGARCLPRGGSLPVARSKEQDPALSAFSALSIFAGGSPAPGASPSRKGLEWETGFPVSADKEGATVSPRLLSREPLQMGCAAKKQQRLGTVVMVRDGVMGLQPHACPFPGMRNRGEAGTGTGSGCRWSQDTNTGPGGGSGVRPGWPNTHGGAGRGRGWPGGLPGQGGCPCHSAMSVCPSTRLLSLLEAPSHRGGSGRALGTSPGDCGSESLGGKKDAPRVPAPRRGHSVQVGSAKPSSHPCSPSPPGTGVL